MNTDYYDISNSYVHGGNISEQVKSFAEKYIGGHAVMALALIIALAIIIIFLLIWKSKESFNPTQTLRFQKMDDLGRRENLDASSTTATTATTAPAAGTDRSTSVFAQQVQDTGMGSFTVDPNAAAGAPGSLGYQILNSPDFDCAHRTPIGSNAWDWMANVAKENLVGARANNSDSQFSKIAMGY